MPTNIVSFFVRTLSLSCFLHFEGANRRTGILLSVFLTFPASGGLWSADGEGRAFPLLPDTAFPVCRRLFWLWIRHFRRPEVCFGSGYDVSSVPKFILAPDTTFPASRSLFWLRIRRFQRPKVCFGSGYDISSIKMFSKVKDTTYLTPKYLQRLRTYRIQS